MHSDGSWIGAPTLSIAIHADDQAGLIDSVNAAISECRSTLRRIYAQAGDEHATIQLQVELELIDGNTLADIMLALTSIPGVRHVKSMPHA